MSIPKTWVTVYTAGIECYPSIRKGNDLDEIQWGRLCVHFSPVPGGVRKRRVGRAAQARIEIEGRTSTRFPNQALTGRR